MGRRHRRSQAGLSLIEMVVVLGIMSILSTLTLVSFRALSAASLTSAGNSVATALTWARQNSITKSVFTAFVVKTSPGDAYSSYCLLQLQVNPDGSYGDWTRVTPWRQLPRSIYFYSSSGITDNFLNASDTVPVSLPTNFSYEGQTIDLTQASVYHVYQPDGSLISNQEVRLRLLEGSADPATGTVTPRGAGGSSQPSDIYDVLILRDTGQVSVVRS